MVTEISVVCMQPCSVVTEINFVCIQLCSRAAPFELWHALLLTGLRLHLRGPYEPWIMAAPALVHAAFVTLSSRHIHASGPVNQHWQSRACSRTTNGTACTQQGLPRPSTREGAAARSRVRSLRLSATGAEAKPCASQGRSGLTCVYNSRKVADPTSCTGASICSVHWQAPTMLDVLKLSPPTACSSAAEVLTRAAARPKLTIAPYVDCACQVKHAAPGKQADQIT